MHPLSHLILLSSHSELSQKQASLTQEDPAKLREQVADFERRVKEEESELVSKERAYADYESAVRECEVAKLRIPFVFLFDSSSCSQQTHHGRAMVKKLDTAFAFLQGHASNRV